MSGPGHILLVDDNADLRETMALLLRCDGHLVTEAADGQLALNALATPTTFRLIILDLMMPVMDGAAFLANKAKGVHAAIPVVVFSSSPSIGMEEHASVVSVVSKLDGIDGLLAAVQRAEGAPPPPHAPAGGFLV